MAIGMHQLDQKELENRIREVAGRPEALPNVNAVAGLPDLLKALQDDLARALKDAKLPPGAVIGFASSVPDGFLACDGSEISRADQKDLFAAIGTTFGSASSSTFTLPALADIDTGVVWGIKT